MKKHSLQHLIDTFWIKVKWRADALEKMTMFRVHAHSYAFWKTFQFFINDDLSTLTKCFKTSYAGVPLPDWSEGRMENRMKNRAVGELASEENNNRR